MKEFFPPTEVKKEAKTAIIFQGQGTQYPGMGKDLYQKSLAARRTFDKMEEICDFSLTKVCFEGPEVELNRTEIAQPAIFAYDMALLAAAQEAGFDMNELIKKTDCAAGHSLGEYIALPLLKVVSWEEASIIVIERAKLSGKAKGEMWVVMGPNLDEVTLEEVCYETGAFLANYNSPTQYTFVAANHEQAVRTADLAKARGIKRVIKLSVSAPFHSELMSEIVPEFCKFIQPIPFNDPVVPFVANCDGQPKRTGQEVKKAIIASLHYPNRWSAVVSWMLEQGITNFLEIGPKTSILARLIRQTAESLNFPYKVVDLNSFIFPK